MDYDTSMIREPAAVAGEKTVLNVSSNTISSPFDIVRRRGPSELLFKSSTVGLVVRHRYGGLSHPNVFENVFPWGVFRGRY
jgi:hypothetical protein